ncbi:DUF4192 domain-containing protein, partial [Kitasatospora sp. LaBMicrA B282]|uniref:DUF4192 domain-containing protein n=1 Tax=Kitasatospora sp. LaBMicrA B282 TaxID=3420949 RepID=UPI003D0E6890
MTHYDPHPESHHHPAVPQLLRLKGPSDLAAMLPYLLGFHPDDSIVVVGLHGSMYRQGSAIRADIPPDRADWPAIARDLARLLLEVSRQHGSRPVAALLYLCRDPEPGARPVLRQLRPLAGLFGAVFGEFELPIKESLCISGGRWWSFHCSDQTCCGPAGTAVRLGRDPAPVVVAATVAGLAPRGSRKELAAELTPFGPPVARGQRHALERELGRLAASLAEPGGEEREQERVERLVARAMAESRGGPPELDEQRVAQLIVGLQNRGNRDRAAEYSEPDELATAQHLWRFLARRCVPPFEEFAKAPLTLLAWTCWLSGDLATSRVALGMALDRDPTYTLADLLYHSVNGGMEPDALLAVVRTERLRRAAGSGLGGAVAPEEDGLPDPGGPPGGPG